MLLHNVCIWCVCVFILMLVCLCDCLQRDNWGLLMKFFKKKGVQPGGADITQEEMNDIMQVCVCVCAVSVMLSGCVCVCVVLVVGAVSV